MTLHAVSRVCHHPDGLVRFSKGSDDMSNYIVGISKPSNTESKTKVIEGLVLDAELLDRVFKVLVTTVKFILHGCCLTFSQVCRPKNRQERRSRNKKSLQQSSILKSLATWGKYDGITTLIKSMLNGYESVSLGQSEVKVLSSYGVALYCNDTIKALEAKHPYKPPLSMPSNTFYEPPFVAEIDSVFGCIISFPKGRCPPILAEFVASAPLPLLLKLDNGIRPITVSTI
ncbi:hypothetical protein Tco_0278698 [Tanacetum coccineum]